VKIFIGSSKEALNDAQWLAAQIEQFGHESVPWYSPGLFRLGDHTLESLFRIVAEVDAAAFVFGEDDLSWYRGALSSQTRDNVLIEYGLFSGLLGAHRAAICRTGSPRQSTDLAGVVYLDINSARRHQSTLEIRQWIASLSADHQKRRETGRERAIFEHVNHGEFLVEAETLIACATRVTMMGSGLSILAHNPLVTSLLAHSASGDCQVDLYFADPFCTSVEDRLIEEESGEVQPQDGKAGLLGRVRMILSAWHRAGSPKAFKVAFLRNYPTLALIVIDGAYYMYPYAYAMLARISHGH
jgi:hypothetical protein